MSLGDLLPVQFFELLFLCTLFMLPVLVFWSLLELYCFGILVVYMLLRVLRKRKRKVLSADNKAVFISGCDSGFGHMAAIRLDAKGYRVFAGCLKDTEEGAASLKLTCSNRLSIVSLDVTSEDSVKSAGNFVREHIGNDKLWSLINNAGIYGHGDVELCNIGTYQRLADVNVFGMIRVTQEFLPLIREHQGRIINMSGVNGRLPWPSTSAYSASHAGVEMISDCLRMEMLKFGVKVILIEPAMFGGSTNIHSNENIENHHAEIEKLFASCREEVKETYSKQYMKDQIDILAQLRKKLDANSPDVVINAVDDAVSSSSPLYRYLVHGSPYPVDPMAVFGMTYPYLPEFVTDWIICHITGHQTKDILRRQTQVFYNENNLKTE